MKPSAAFTQRVTQRLRALEPNADDARVAAVVAAVAAKCAWNDWISADMLTGFLADQLDAAVVAEAHVVAAAEANRQVEDRSILLGGHTLEEFKRLSPEKRLAILHAGREKLKAVGRETPPVGQMTFDYLRGAEAPAPRQQRPTSNESPQTAAARARVAAGTASPQDRLRIARIDGVA